MQNCSSRGCMWVVIQCVCGWLAGAEAHVTYTLKTGQTRAKEHRHRNVKL